MYIGTYSTFKLFLFVGAVPLSLSVWLCCEFFVLSLRGIGVPIAEVKTVGPAQVITYLGLDEIGPLVFVTR